MQLLIPTIHSLASGGAACSESDVSHDFSGNVHARRLLETLKARCGIHFYDRVAALAPDNVHARDIEAKHLCRPKRHNHSRSSSSG